MSTSFGSSVLSEYPQLRPIDPFLTSQSLFSLFHPIRCARPKKGCRLQESYLIRRILPSRDVANESAAAPRRKTSLVLAPPSPRPVA